MYRGIFTILAALLVLAVPAQGVITFERVIGGDSVDIGYYASQTSDGGYIVAGKTNSSGGGWYDFYLIKTNEWGFVTWSKTYGGSNIDICFSVQQTSDGGYIMTGTTASFGAGSFDFWLVKTDGSGTQSWAKTYGAATHDEAFCVQQTTDGGYIVTGGMFSFDLCLLKTNASGDSVWAHTHGATDKWEKGHFVRQTSDGGYIAAGFTTSEGAGGRDVWLVRTDSLCNINWRKTYGGTQDDEAYCVKQTSDGGFIATGYTKSEGAGGSDVYVIRTNPSGDTVWTRTFGGTADDVGRGIIETFDGKYVVAGHTESEGAGGGDVYLIKIDPSTGSMLWKKTYGGISGEQGYSIEETSDHGFIITGYTGSYGPGPINLYLLKTDQNGDTLGVEENPKFSPTKCRVQVFPNPVTGSTIVRVKSYKPLAASLKLYSLAGREIKRLFTGTLLGEEVVTLRASPGIYFVKLDTEVGTQVIKVVFLR